MSIKGKIKNNIDYNGDIKVTINDRGHKSELKLHNNGTKLLFDIITKALAGYSIKGETPQYIDIKYTKNNEDFSIETNPYLSALLSPIVITGKIYGPPAGATTEQEFGRLQMEAELDHSVKIDGISGYNWKLQLLNNSLEELAYIDNTNSQVSNIYDAITTNHEVIIEWALQFSNPT